MRMISLFDSISIMNYAGSELSSLVICDSNSVCLCLNVCININKKSEKNMHIDEQGNQSLFAFKVIYSQCCFSVWSLRGAEIDSAAYVSGGHAANVCFIFIRFFICNVVHISDL